MPEDNARPVETRVINYATDFPHEVVDMMNKGVCSEGWRPFGFQQMVVGAPPNHKFHYQVWFWRYKDA